MPSLVFYRSYANNDEENLLVQAWTGFTFEQIEIIVTSKFIATSYEVNDTLFWTFWG